MREFGVYIHIPFCQQKCFYCDFPSFAGRERYIDSYLEALEQEIILWKSQNPCQDILAFDGRLSPATIYIGGGTPTALEALQLEKLLQIISKHIVVEVAGEFTVEMNPGTVDAPKLDVLQKYGINRLSVGVQSFDDICLKKIGRIHTAQEAEDIIHKAQVMGFGNISLDLIYGLPGQDMDILQQSVARALALDVQHISIYGLQLEEGTVFDRLEQMGKLQLPEDTLVEKMYDYITKILPEAGYERYEISNFAQPGYESHHNLSYWQDVPYLGFGSGAHGYWQGYRYENPADIAEYIGKLQEKTLPSQLEEKVTEQAHMEEFCFLGLRTAKGISAKVFAEKFGSSLPEVYGDAIKKLSLEGLLEKDSQGIRLTAKGMKYGNQVFSEFLL